MDDIDSCNSPMWHFYGRKSVLLSKLNKGIKRVKTEPTVPVKFVIQMYYILYIKYMY